MKTSLDDIYTRAKQLSAGDRATLATRLLEDLDGPADEGVEEAWSQEIDRRLAAFDRGDIQAIPAGEVLRKIRARKSR